MANVRLKNIQFPGLDNTYTIPDEAPAYSTSGTYAVGDMVIYDGKLYKCTTAITTAEAWTAAHWSETKMGNEVSALKTALTAVASKAVKFNLLDGYNLSWENKLISGAGAVSVSAYAITSEFISVQDFAESDVSFSGATFLDGTETYCYVVLYSDNQNTDFLDRRLLYGSGAYYTVTLTNNCKYIRFVYAHANATHKQMPLTNSTYFHAMLFYNTIETIETIENDVDANKNAIQLLSAIGLHTLPQSEGVLNVVKRCRQMTDIKWTPSVDLPRLNSVSGNFEEDPLVVYEGVFKAGTEYKGLPYGRTDGNISGSIYAFIGFEIGFDTFISSVCNPDSMLCSTSQYDQANHKSVKYAVVCSALSSYAFGWNYTTTQNIPTHQGVSKITDIVNDGVRMDLSLIKLGDIVCKPSWHVGIVTDIVKDANGNVAVIEISEATTLGNGNQDISGGKYGGICRRRGWEVEDFFETWGTYGIYRFSGIDNVTYTPSKYVNVGDELDVMRYDEFPCMPYMGEGFTYKSGAISNTDILISCNDYSYLRVFKDGTEIDNSPFALTSSTEKVAVGFSETGNYSAYLCNMANGNDTAKTQSCHWNVIA